MFESLRKVELITDSSAKIIAFKELSKGDRFKIYEPNDEPITATVNGELVDIFEAVTDAYLNDDNIYTIQISE